MREGANRPDPAQDSAGSDAPSFPGIRCDEYPGDAAIRAWALASPYRFLAFPIAGPDSHWLGKAQLVRSFGWGLAILYSGSADMDHGSVALTRAAGAADARDAVLRCRREELAPGTVCYLDVEVSREEPGLTLAQLDYCRGWIGTVLDSGTVQPGFCCEESHAELLSAATQDEYADRSLSSGAPRLWVIGPERAKSLAGADVSQSSDAVPAESHGGVRLSVYRCLASSPDPSLTGGPLDPATFAPALRPVVGAAVRSPDLSPAIADARALIDACLGAVAMPRPGWVPPFPRGIGSVEVEVTGHDGSTTARVRISAK